MKTEIVPAVMDVARQTTEPAAAKPGPNKQTHCRDHQTDKDQIFSKVVHALNQSRDIPGERYLTTNSPNRLTKRFQRFIQRAHLKGVLPKSPVLKLFNWERTSERAIMMGVHQPQSQLFNYQVNLERRLRADHPLRRVAQAVDFSFIRAEVAHCYGNNGNESIDPVILLKMMFLLFWDNVPSERELMGVIRERLDYLWFLGYGLDDEVPNHSVLSKARKRWGKDLFEQLFVRTVHQCAAAGLVSGDKLHVDASLIGANASKDSVIKSSPELIAAYKAAYAVAESKLDEPPRNHPNYEAVNDRMLSTTDPDAGLVRKGSGSSRPAYHHHRAVDDAHGVITAVETTSGAVPENQKLTDLLEQHQQHTGSAVRTVVGDHKYGTADNFIACYEKSILTHLGDAKAKQATAGAGRFKESNFIYDRTRDCYLCPAGQILKRKRYVKKQRAWEYAPARGLCAHCPLREDCTKSKTGRVVSRHEQHEILEECRAQAHSPAAIRDRRRRQYLIEGSFADAANNHGFKRARWRRLWRQQIQDYLIAAIQNIRILLARQLLKPASSGALVFGRVLRLKIQCWLCLLEPAGALFQTQSPFGRKLSR